MWIGPSGVVCFIRSMARLNFQPFIAQKNEFARTLKIVVDPIDSPNVGIPSCAGA